MGSEWPSIKLENIGEIKSGKRLPKGEELTEYKTAFPYIRLVDVVEGQVQDNNLKFITATVREKIKRYVVNTDDVCLAIVGHTIGMVFYIEEHWDNVNLTENAARITNVRSEFNPKFIYYYLISEVGQSEIMSRIVGSAQGKLPLYNIKSIEIPCPIRNEQDDIVNILMSLDNKIQLNRQTNQTLEQMAQALFKSWFVDFDPVIDNALAAGKPIPEELQARVQRRQQQLAKPDHQPLPDEVRQLFPSEFEETEALGWVPKGWEVKKADEVTDVAIGKTPPRKQSEWFSGSKQSNVVWVSIRDMGGISTHILDSSEYLTKEAIEKFNVKVVPKGSVLLSFKLTLGRVCIAACDLTTNEAIAHFSNLKYKLCKEYLYCYLKNFNYEKLGSTSSIATAVNSKIIKSMPILVPSESVLDVFRVTSKDWFSRMELIFSESCSLSILRDTLLPKLISGELRLPDSLLDSESNPLMDEVS